MKAALVCPYSQDVPPALPGSPADPAKEQNRLICARCNASPGSQSAANIRQGAARPPRRRPAYVVPS